MKKHFMFVLALIFILSMIPFSVNASKSGNEVYLDSTNGIDTNSGSSSGTAVKTLKQAFTLLKDTGGTVIVSGDTVVDDASFVTDDRSDINGFDIVLPEHSEKIYIKGLKKSDGTYTKLIKSSVTAPIVTITFGGDVELYNITIENTVAKNWNWYLMGNSFTAANNVTCIGTQADKYCPKIWGYSAMATNPATPLTSVTYKKDQYINIYSGMFYHIKGTAIVTTVVLNGITGNQTINLYGGTILNDCSATHTTGLTGTSTINLYSSMILGTELTYCSGNSDIISTSTLNMYNFTTDQETALLARASFTGFTTVNKGLTGTIPAAPSDNNAGSTEVETTTASTEVATTTVSTTAASTTAASTTAASTTVDAAADTSSQTETNDVGTGNKGCGSLITSTFALFAVTLTGFSVSRKIKKVK